MPKLPAVDGRTTIKVLESFGWFVDRVSSSHHVMKRTGHRNNVSVPVHGSKSLPSGTLRSIIRDAGLTVEAFVERLETV